MKKPWIIPFILLLVIGIAASGWGEKSPSAAASESDIVFSHKFHVVENEVECEDCHANIETSSLGSDDNLPSMDDCGNCHDVEDDEQCGICHKNTDEPGGYALIERELVFSHEKHLGIKAECGDCHAGVESSVGYDPNVMPGMRVCSECHDGAQAANECAICHSGDVTLLDIHPLEWSHQHGQRASSEPQWCGECHTGQEFCLDCHRGDNILGEIHDLNYIYTHGLDARGKAADCGQCHDNQDFCVACHESGRRMPLVHSTLSWGTDHGRYAREDVENCASCHESGDPTCARAGCHNDFDGMRGTDSRIHSADAAQFDMAGPWHDDDGYYCYQCHLKTPAGDGFCGYCHH